MGMKKLILGVILGSAIILCMAALYNWQGIIETVGAVFEMLSGGLFGASN